MHSDYVNPAIRQLRDQQVRLRRGRSDWSR